VKLMGRSDCCTKRTHGVKVFVGGKLCGIWPRDAHTGWVEFECPKDTKGTAVKVVQPRGTPLTICGVEVHGEATGEKPDDKEEKREVMFELATFDQSSISNKYEWSAQKLIQYMGAPVTDISANWNTQTCTYSQHGPGEWQSVSMSDEHEVTKIRLIGRSDEKQDRNFGNKVYAINDSGEKKVLCGTWPKGDQYTNKWVEFACPKDTKAKTIKVEKPDKGVLTLCNVEVFGYKKEEEKKDDDDKKKKTTTTSLDNAAATVEVATEDIVKVKEGTDEVITTETTERFEDTITTVDVNTEEGWKKWAKEVKARTIKIEPNQGFVEEPITLKTNSFVELVGTVNNDQGYEWFWEATNGFKLKNVKTKSYYEDPNDQTIATVHIMLQVMDNKDKKEFDLKWLYQPGWNYNRNFRDGQKFKVDGKEEGKVFVTQYKAQEGSIWKKVKAGIRDMKGNTGSEDLEHGNWWDKDQTYTKSQDDAGQWQTVLTSSRSTKKTKSVSDYKKTTTSTERYTTQDQDKNEYSDNESNNWNNNG